jgi:hypothetical protein
MQFLIIEIISIKLNLDYKQKENAHSPIIITPPILGSITFNIKDNFMKLNLLLKICSQTLRDL